MRGRGMRQCAARRGPGKHDRPSRMMVPVTKRWLLPLILLASGACLSAACSEEEQEETHYEEAPECEAIGDVCTHDVSGELAEECHELAHANDADECAARQEECVDFCSSHMGEGGGSGASH